MSCWIVAEKDKQVGLWLINLLHKRQLGHFSVCHFFILLQLCPTKIGIFWPNGSLLVAVSIFLWFFYSNSLAPGLEIQSRTSWWGKSYKWIGKISQMQLTCALLSLSVSIYILYLYEELLTIHYMWFIWHAASNKAELHKNSAALLKQEQKGKHIININMNCTFMYFNSINHQLKNS